MPGAACWRSIPSLYTLPLETASSFLQAVHGKPWLHSDEVSRANDTGFLTWHWPDNVAKTWCEGMDNGDGKLCYRTDTLL